MSELVSAASFCATKEHTTRETKAAGHFDTFVSSMITFAKNDDNSKFNEYLSSLLRIDYDETTVSDSESDDSDDEEEI